MRERLINAFAADFTVWLIVMDQGVNTKKQLGNPQNGCLLGIQKVIGVRSVVERERMFL
jgi:hypothetical protein